MSVNFEGVQAAIAKNATILDVRNHDDVEKDGKIPGSHNLPLPELEDALRLDSSEFEAKHGFPKPQKGDEIITHCMKGGRGGKATEALNARGYHNVKTYQGSFSDWVAQGGEVDKHDH